MSYRKFPLEPSETDAPCDSCGQPATLALVLVPPPGQGLPKTRALLCDTHVESTLEGDE